MKISEITEGFADWFKKKPTGPLPMTDKDIAMIQSVDDRARDNMKVHGAKPTDEPTYNLQSQYRVSGKVGGIELIYHKESDGFVVTIQTYKIRSQPSTAGNPAGITYGTRHGLKFSDQFGLNAIFNKIAEQLESGD